MLCPEVWEFPPPAVCYKFKRGESDVDASYCKNLINLHHFNNLVSVVFPNTNNIPENLKELLSEDSDYYRVKNISLTELINKEFIEAFVKQGQLCALSDGMRLDVDDCVCITPSGLLVLSIQRDTYLGLGLDGKPSAFCRSKPDRYLVTVDLREPCMAPGRRRYKQVHSALARVTASFDLLLAWEPPEQRVCPSSVAAYFNGRGFSVALAKCRTASRSVQSVPVPPADTEPALLLEWLGAISLGVDLMAGGPGNYTNSYQPPDGSMMCDKVLVVKWTGLFTPTRLQTFYEAFKEFAATCKPWAALHVQGFQDSPLGWGGDEQQFSGEPPAYTLVLGPGPHWLAASVLGVRRRPRARSRVHKPK